VKNLLRPTRHIDAIIVAPLDQQVPAFEMNRDFTFGPTRKYSGNANR
jgi:hypothetical protein